MARADRMPTTTALLVISWIVAVLGLSGGGLLVILNLNEIDLLIKGSLVLFGSLVISVIIRMFANIGQMIFDIRDNLQGIRNVCEQLKIFFGQIEKHLNLKK